MSLNGSYFNSNKSTKQATAVNITKAGSSDSVLVNNHLLVCTGRSLLTIGRKCALCLEAMHLTAIHIQLWFTIIVPNGKNDNSIKLISFASFKNRFFQLKHPHLFSEKLTFRFSSIHWQHRHRKNRRYSLI